MKLKLLLLPLFLAAFSTAQSDGQQGEQTTRPPTNESGNTLLLRRAH